MKKIIVLLIVLTMLLTLVACDGDKPNDENPLNRDPGTSQDGNTNSENASGDINIGDLISGDSGTDIILSETDSAYKAELIRQAEESGMTVSFGNDGSTTITDEEGNKYIQTKDGTWLYEGVNGETAVIGGNIQWPANEFTAILPKPSMKLSFVDSYTDTFTVQFSSGTMDDAKAYVAQLKTEGFITTEDERTIMGVYAYNATDRTEKYDVLISYIDGEGVILSVGKIDEYGDSGDYQDDVSEQEDYSVDSLEEWPQNDVTAGVPKPDLAIQMVMSEENTVLVYCSATSISKAKNYIQELKDAGYNMNIVESDEDEDMYIFQADNSDGNKVSVTWVNGDGVTINIYKSN